MVKFYKVNSKDYSIDDELLISEVFLRIFDRFVSISKYPGGFMLSFGCHSMYVLEYINTKKRMDLAKFVNHETLYFKIGV